MTANYYRNAHAVVCVYSVEDESSLYALNEWVAEARAMNRHEDRMVLALWGSKCDLETKSHVTVKADVVEAFTSTYHIPPHLNRKVSVFGDSAVTALNELVEHIDSHFTAAVTTDGSQQHRYFDTLTPQQLVQETDTQQSRCCFKN